MFRFLDLHLKFDDSGKLSTKIYDKRDDFNFDIVNFPYLDGDVPRAPSYGIYISQLVRYARASTYVQDFNDRNLNLTKKNFSNKDIVLINSEKLFQNFIVGIQICYQSIINP